MTVTLIGAGNLATQLALALHERGIKINQVYSRTNESAKTLADLVCAKHTTCANDIEDGADFYIYSLKDDALDEIISQTAAQDGIHLHTAGSVDMSIFQGRKKRHGVMYPMQTFSKSKKVDFGKIPVFVEGSDNETAESIKALAKRLSDNVTNCDSRQRMTLHLGAVFCCNYSNYLYRVTEKLMNDQGLDFKVMLPLLEETVEKLRTLTAKDAQTGPAARHDMSVINKHIKALESYPAYQKLYEDLAGRIMNEK
ncbi:MAG: DUF2520 domain-containing protein [Paludibacteraceae bacterium]|nr:DUF2520 domain-containing protein [Paludibacteraceae bacterium]